MAEQGCCERERAYLDVLWRPLRGGGRGGMVVGVYERMGLVSYLSFERGVCLGIGWVGKEQRHFQGGRAHSKLRKWSRDTT